MYIDRYQFPLDYLGLITTRIVTETQFYSALDKDDVRIQIPC
jgi:hypothetical protein